MRGAADGDDQEHAILHAVMMLPTSWVLSTLAAAMLLAGCFQPSTGTDIDEPGTQPPGNLFGADAGTGTTCTTPDPSPLSLLTVTLRTTPFGGRYSPRNVGAIWIEDSQGVFIKTLERWGSTRARYLVKWQTASKGNVADAVTGATLNTHRTHTREWDLTDSTTCEVPTGDYRVVAEHTDYNGAGAYIVMPFHKQDPMTVTPMETAMFHDLMIELR
jgi:hypothetical protein